MAALIVSALIAIAAANAAWWWQKGRIDQQRIDTLTAKVAALIVSENRARSDAKAASADRAAAHADIANLRARNVMLTGLIGGEPQ